jgi:hypothetical protein
MIWEQFRNVPNFTDVDIDIAHKLTKKTANIMFVELRKLHYNVMRRVMDTNEADILVGRAKTVSANNMLCMNWINLLRLMLRVGINLE